MTPVSIRLAEFSKLYPDTKKATIQSILAADEAPFDPKSDEGKQRTYGCSEILAWYLYIQMRNMGLPATFSANQIRASNIVDQIFAAYDRPGDDMADLFLIVDRHEKRDNTGDVRVIWGVSLQPFEAVSEILTKGAASHGTTNLRGETRLGLSGATIIPIAPCLERCASALDAAGFIMDGPRLYEKD